MHRDVKPDNVYVARQADGTDLVKVLDFGMAKIGSSLGSSALHTVLGAAAYMSPEQSLAEPVDARSDIYSFGVLLFRMPRSPSVRGRVARGPASPPAVFAHASARLVGWTGRSEPRSDRRQRDPQVPEAIATRAWPSSFVDLEQVARGREAAVSLRPLVSPRRTRMNRLTDQGDRAVSLLAKKFGQYARVPELRSRIRKSTDT